MLHNVHNIDFCQYFDIKVDWLFFFDYNYH